MSRRLLVAAGGSGTGNPPIDPEDPDPPGTTSAWPTTADATVLALRPDGRVLGARYATNDSEVTAADGELLSAVATNGQAGGYLAWGGSGPDYATRLVLALGTFADSAATDWRAVVGAGGPAARSIISKDYASSGTVHSFGSSYLENLHIKAIGAVPNVNAPKYPWHITGGTYSVAANCTFDCSGITEVPTAFVGADGESGQLIVFYKCDFIPGTDDGSFNIHGPADASTPALPLSLVFVDCTGLDGVGLSVPAGVAGNGDGSSLYVINTPCASLYGVAGCHIYTDADAPAAGDNAATIHRDATWTAPDGSLTDEARDRFYPSALVAPFATQRITGLTTAPFQPSTSRIYYTRVRLEQALRVTHTGVVVSTVAGNAQLRCEPNDNGAAPVGSALALPDAVPTTLGDTEWQHYYARTRYPGNPGFWVAMKFTNASVRVIGSTELEAGDMYYSDDDGTTVTAVTAGTLHPLAFVRGT